MRAVTGLPTERSPCPTGAACPRLYESTNPWYKAMTPAQSPQGSLHVFLSAYYLPTDIVRRTSPMAKKSKTPVSDDGEAPGPELVETTQFPCLQCFETDVGHECLYVEGRKGCEQCRKGRIRCSARSGEYSRSSAFPRYSTGFKTSLRVSMTPTLCASSARLAPTSPSPAGVSLGWSSPSRESRLAYTKLRARAPSSGPALSSTSPWK